MVIDLSRANPGAPATLKQLIAGWDANTGTRLAALAASSAQKAPAFSMPVAQVKILPPIPDPKVLLSTAVNYTEHAIEMTGNSNTAATAAAVDPKVAQGIPGYWQRRPGDPRLGPGRDRDGGGGAHPREGRFRPRTAPVVSERSVTHGRAIAP